MWGKTRRIIGLTISLVLISIMAQGVVSPRGTPALANTPDSVQVSINAPSEVAPGTDFTVTVDISQVENFDAGNYNVSFNPTVLRLDNVTSGNIGGTVIPVNIWNETSPGIVSIIQNVPGVSGVSGSGYLAVLHFHIISSQSKSSNISLSNGVLGNYLAQEIPTTWTGGLVQVVSVEPAGQGTPTTPASLPDSTTPEPETTTSEAETTVSEPETTATEPETTITEPETTITEPEKEGEESLMTAALPPEAGSTDVSKVTPAPPPPPPAARAVSVDWPVLWGVIGGVVIAIGLVIFFLVIRRAY